MGLVMDRCSARHAGTLSNILATTVLAGLAASLAFSGAVFAAESVTNTLSVYRVVRGADGAEQKVVAASAKPGDVLEYQATYRNSGAAEVRKLLATIPIPGGATYVLGSPLPDNATASLDGINYARIPLMRAVKRPDGSTVEQPVAASEYRFVRWTVDALGAGAAVTVAMRVSVTADAAPAAAKLAP